MSQYLSSSIDSSDGLALSLYELAKESNVDLLIHKDKIPIPPELQKFSMMNNLDMDDLIYYGGEEYHIIGTVSKKNLRKVNTLAKKHCLNFFITGGPVTRRQVFWGGKFSNGPGKLFKIRVLRFNVRRFLNV